MTFVYPVGSNKVHPAPLSPEYKELDQAGAEQTLNPDAPYAL